MTSHKQKHVVHWFRKGLRLHDQPALREGLQGATTLRCVFILDPWFAGSSNVGINKWRFLLQCLENLDSNLRKLNSRLFVIRGQPADVFPRLFKLWKTTHLTFEKAQTHMEGWGIHNPQMAQENGFDTENLKPPVWIGGETEALARLERHLERKAWVASFGRPKMTPQSLLPSQTGLSPYLRFGCLSARLFYQELTELYRKIKKVNPPLSLHGQILWREFFYCAATNNPKFDHMIGNSMCVQIPWDTNSEALAKWTNGQTGFPWIDAIMTQLREEGWIHHVARHAVACFLTRGDLWISWEEGMKVFDELLLDADWSVNAGSWMWLSCSSFFQQFFHLYCPVRFGRKADPNGDYIRRYLPVLKNFPTKYIHEPWVAPEKVQIAAKCIIGKDYPMPMVNHQEVSHINLERMKQVYQQLSHYRGASMYSSSHIQQTNQRESDDGYPKNAKRRAVEYPDDSGQVQKRDTTLK
ncbi:Cryptochrome-1 like protein [Argiope bruennichi]|uniref:Cryptochrome-1 like protein n=1 Tax=Argiope bruennichi TaxID=94029 RepID=A0A8T0E0A3_ARGBR|nr:Cryptochrome-1 like protein [Argiope bruennichi]